MKALRIVTALALIVVAVAVVSHADAYRGLEARLAAIALVPFVPGQAGFSGDVFWVSSQHFAGAFKVTVECTATILIVPMLGLGAVLAVWTRAAIWRVLLGVVLSYLVITAANETRLALIGWASSQFGMDMGFPLAHTLLGSIIALLGFAAGIATLLVISDGPRPKTLAGTGTKPRPAGRNPR